MNEQFGYAVRVFERDALHRDWCDEREAAGALYEAEGVGIHPLKFTYGLAARARALGVRLHTASPVQDWSVRGGVHHLRTPGGTVRARRVAVCTGGYTGQRLNPLLKNRLMPILSNSVVTRVLTEAERTACNLRSQTFMTDTRALRFYYRLLKDNRLQIGSRSAVTGADAADPVHEKLLTDAIARKFPPLAGIAIDHSWWGWVDVSHDMMPRIARPDPAAEPLVRARLRRQRRLVLDPGRQAARRAHRRPGRRPSRLRPADLPLGAAVSERPRGGRGRGFRTLPAHRPAHALQVVLAARREALKAIRPA